MLVGVGNPVAGKSVGGHQSRQDVSALRQSAVRVNGAYHDGNEKHLSTDLVARTDERATPPAAERVSLREYARWAVGLGARLAGLGPLALAALGTGWSPGRSPGRERLAAVPGVG